VTPAAQLSVVIVTHRCAGSVGRTLGLVREQLGSGDEIVVVDNASTDASAEVARRLGAAPGDRPEPAYSS
jgi:glycosyltransferase involved in cell wall biosynthesis